MSNRRSRPRTRATARPPTNAADPNDRLRDLGLTFENTEEAWYANYPRTGHNSNTDAEAQVAMFRLCAQLVQTSDAAGEEPIVDAERWAALRTGADDGDIGSMASLVVSAHDPSRGVASVCASVCGGGSVDAPTRETGWRNAKGIHTTRTLATTPTARWFVRATRRVKTRAGRSFTGNGRGHGRRRAVLVHGRGTP